MSAARHNIEVVATQDLSPNRRRVTFTSRQLEELATQRPAQTLKLFIPHDGGTTARPYTVRAVNTKTREFDIDFALYADGPASTWALSAKTGANLECAAARGGFEYSSDIDWYLLIGDETSLPAIAAITEAARRCWQ